MIKSIGFPLILFLIGLIFAGVYSLLTSHLFIQNRVLHSPLGSPPPFSISDAPSQSIRGSMQIVSGIVSWESRTATIPAALTSPVTLEQGESVLTDMTGRAVTSFPKVGTIILSPQTEVDFIQSLPTSFLTYQPTGTAKYSKDGSGPLSVRSMSFLISVDSGDVSVTADQDLGRISIVTAGSGQATVAYNSLDNVSQIVTVPQSSTFVFDDAARDYVSE